MLTSQAAIEWARSRFVSNPPLSLSMSDSSLLPSSQAAYDPAEKPPSFGHALKKYFALDHDYVNLNNGAPPHFVIWTNQTHCKV